MKNTLFKIGEKVVVDGIFNATIEGISVNRNITFYRVRHCKITNPCYDRYVTADRINYI